MSVILAARIIRMPLNLLLFFTTNLKPVEILRGNCGVKNLSNFCTHATFFPFGNTPHGKHSSSIKNI
jgi:hypothetical protein